MTPALYISTIPTGCPILLMHGYTGKTNTQSNTAFRGFGGLGAIAIEYIMGD